MHEIVNVDDFSEGALEEFCTGNPECLRYFSPGQYEVLQPNTFEEFRHAHRNSLDNAHI